jgi:hypothetical protein
MGSSTGVVSQTPMYVQGVDGAGAANPAGTATDPKYWQTGPLPAGTDRSGTAGTASGLLAPANSARRGLNIQNVSAVNMGVNEFAAAAVIGAAGTYTLAAGAALNVRTNRQINIVAASAGAAYTATEF